MYCDSPHNENVHQDTPGSPRHYCIQKTKSRFCHVDFRYGSLNFTERFPRAKAYLNRPVNNRLGRFLFHEGPSA